MFQTGLLVLTSPLKLIRTHLGTILKDAHKVVKNRLYIKLDPSFIDKQNIITQHDKSHLASLIPYIYYEASKSCESLDVRVLQSYVKSKNFNTDHFKHLLQDLDVILSDSNPLKFKDELKNQFILDSPSIEYKYLENYKNLITNVEANETDKKDFPRLFQNTVLGGTFDRLHNGHKLLLSEALLRTTNQLTIGITDGVMLHNKLLWEMIQPLEFRMSKIREFVTDVDPTVKPQIVPIYDPFGPSTVDQDLDCIIVSEETKKGGLKVNEEREKKGMSLLSIHTIDLILDKEGCEQIEDAKISSSAQRIKDLGKLIKPKHHLLKTPYVIGLAGNIASGKSGIREYLQQFGADCIDCDKLGHACLQPGTTVYDQIIKTFGAEILDDKKNIDRIKLGRIVFGCEAERQKLNKIVWPEINKMAENEISLLRKKGSKVVVLEAALLIEAGWQHNCHQVWMTFIPKKESIARVMKRHSLTEEQALQRIKAQPLTENEVPLANVLFSTLWDKDFTYQQVARAWEELQPYISAQN